MIPGWVSICLAMAPFHSFPLLLPGLTTAHPSTYTGLHLHFPFRDLCFPAFFLPVSMIVICDAHSLSPYFLHPSPDLLPTPNLSHLEKRTPVVACRKSRTCKEYSGNLNLFENEKAHGENRETDTRRPRDNGKCCPLEVTSQVLPCKDLLVSFLFL